MTTKATMKVLALLEGMAWQPAGLKEEVAAMRAEQDALRHAARVVTQPEQWTTEDWRKAAETLTAVATEEVTEAVEAAGV